MTPEPPAPAVDPVVIEGPVVPVEPVVEVAAVVPPLPPANVLPRPEPSALQAAATRIHACNVLRMVVHSIASMWLRERRATRAHRFARHAYSKHGRTSRSIENRAKKRAFVRTIS